MKKQFLNPFRNALVVLMSSALLFSCSQMDTFEANDLQAEANEAAKSGFNLTPFGDGSENARQFVSSDDCDTECLTLGEDYSFVQQHSQAGSAGNNSKLVTASVELVVNADGTAKYVVNYSSIRTAGSSNADLVISAKVNGVDYGPFVAKVDNTGSFNTPTFEYANIEACDVLTYEITENSFGDDVKFEGTKSLLAFCEESCEEGLAVDLQCGETNTATFTFFAEEAGEVVIQGGLTNGTTITNASSNVLTRNSTHPSVENSNANVTRWEGMVGACEEVTITIEFTDGNGIGDWSAKRGEAVLGSTLKESCN